MRLESSEALNPVVTATWYSQALCSPVKPSARTVLARAARTSLFISTGVNARLNLRGLRIVHALDPGLQVAEWVTLDSPIKGQEVRKTLDRNGVVPAGQMRQLLPAQPMLHLQAVNLPNGLPAEGFTNSLDPAAGHPDVLRAAAISLQRLLVNLQVLGDGGIRTGNDGVRLGQLLLDVSSRRT